MLASLSLFFVSALVNAQQQVATRSQQGRVVDVLGDPVPAARLEVVHGGEVIGFGASDAEGIYHLRAKALSGAWVRVLAQGKAQVRRPWGGLSRGGVENIVLEDACSIRGVVVDRRGAFVADATVVLAGGESVLAVRTDEAGRYELPAAPMRKLHLRAWGSDSFAERTLWLRANSTCDFVLPERGGGRRRVRVQGLPADALASATVEIMSSDVALSKEMGRLQLGPDGTAEFLAGETSLVRLVAPGYESEPAGWLVEPGGSGELVFEATRHGPGGRGAILRGRVVDAGGRGIAGAVLVAENRLHGYAGSCTADADGYFRLETSVPKGAFCRLGIQLGNWQFADDDATVSGRFSWSEIAADPEPLTLRVEPAIALHSEVRTADGNRIPFGDVFIAPSDRPQTLCATLATDRLGAFEVRGLAEGDYMIAAVSARGELATAEVEVEAGKRLKVGRWTWVDSGVVAGEVVDAAGAPMPGVRVHLLSPELVDASGEPMGGRVEAWVRTDRHGRFRCHGLHAGSWLVALPDEPGVGAETVDVEARKTATVGFQLTR